MSDTTLTAAIRSMLRAQLADILYCEQDEIRDSALFNQMGLDSVLGVELVAAVNSEYGLRETVKTLFLHPSVDELTDYLADAVAAGPARAAS